MGLRRRAARWVIGFALFPEWQYGDDLLYPKFEDIDIPSLDIELCTAGDLSSCEERAYPEQTDLAPPEPDKPKTDRELVGEELARIELLLQRSQWDEALEAARNCDENIDLLVTDVVMPLMGGKELADRLKGSNQGIKVLYSTGYTEDTALMREAAAHDSSLLQKPFGPNELAERVRLLLDGR